MPSYAGDEADDHPVAEIVPNTQPHRFRAPKNSGPHHSLSSWGSSRRDESLQLFCPVQDDLHLRGGG